jgi:hypothetical protein
MKKIIVVSIVALMFTIVFVPICNAQMAKEGTDSGINIWSATTTVAPLDKEQYALTYECLGAYLSDTGKGPFHNMSTHNIGVIYHAKGGGKVLGYMIMTAPDGDKVFAELNEDKTPSPPNPSKGTGKYIGGTGKFAGIEGTIEYSRYYVRPAKEGTVQEVAHVKSQWKLPETRK